MGTVLIIIFLGPLLVLIGGVWLYNSPRAVARRNAQWQRAFAESLRGESVEELRNRILTSDYWDLAESSALRDAPAVKELFRRFEAEEYDEILTDLGDGAYVYSVFIGIERSIGYRGRPMIMDYDGLFVPVLKELRRRKGSPPRT
jgi:hypothetical protein